MQNIYENMKYLTEFDLLETFNPKFATIYRYNFNRNE